ncbi:MAG: hypothetical protein ACT4PQ_13885 [Betaproteobacteria bacterium]
MLPSNFTAVTKIPALLLALSAALALGACTVLSPRPVTPISEVVKLSKGAPPEQVVSRIRSWRTTYALRGSDFGRLAAVDVPPEVLDYLQQSFYNDVDLLTRYWATGESLGGCTSCYPQPVDLATLGRNGNGMADPGNTFRDTTFSRPQGLPNWITAVPGRIGAPAITIDQVAQMVRDGRPANEVVAQIDNSRIHGFIDTSGGISNITTHYTVGLSGSELAQLHVNGVPDPVLDALQRKTLAEFIEFHRIRYQSLGKGSIQP